MASSLVFSTLRLIQSSMLERQKREDPRSRRSELLGHGTVTELETKPVLSKNRNVTDRPEWRAFPGL